MTTATSEWSPACDLAVSPAGSVSKNVLRTHATASASPQFQQFPCPSRATTVHTAASQAKDGTRGDFEPLMPGKAHQFPSFSPLRSSASKSSGLGRPPCRAGGSDSTSLVT